MKYGERLLAARNHARLTQGALAEKAGCAQENVSKLERGDAEGSELTVQFAMACGVRPEWLAVEDGEMTVTEHPGRAAGIALMQKMPAYAVPGAVKTLTAFAELPSSPHETPFPNGGNGPTSSSTPARPGARPRRRLKKAS